MSRSEAQVLQSSFIGVVRAWDCCVPTRHRAGRRCRSPKPTPWAKLHARGPITQRPLADALRLQKSTISRLVGQLTNGGLVERAPNPQDRRSRLVGLTTTGMRRARRLEAARRDLFDRLLADLAPDERRLVVDGVARLAQAANALG